MKYTAALLALTLAACGTPKPAVPDGWAATVVKAPDPVPPQCLQQHKVTELQAGDREAVTRNASKVLDNYAALKADYEACSQWARRQRGE